MLLPTVTAFSLSGAPRRYAEAALAMGFAEDSDDAALAGAKLVAGLRSLCTDLQVGGGTSRANRAQFASAVRPHRFLC